MHWIKFLSLLLFSFVLAVCWQPEATNTFDRLLHSPLNLTVLPIYIVISLFALVGLGIIAFLRNNFLRVALGVVLAVLLVTEHGLLNVTGSVAEAATYQSLLDATQEIGFAAETYWRQIALQLSMLLLLLPGIIIPPNERRAFPLVFLSIPVGAFIGVVWAVNAWMGKIEGYPPPFSTGAKLIVAYLSDHIYMGPREELVDRPKQTPSFEKIVFIVDESVRGDYLEVTNPALDNTPFLASIKDQIADFGPAVAYTNCSARSRMALRTGLRLDTLPDPTERAMHQPTMWQFARNAGYKTIFLDGWYTIRKNTSFTTPHEMKFVDSREGPDVRPLPEADNRIADRLMELLGEPGKAFIFVEKIGVHPPYDHAVPEGFDYSPARFPKDLGALRPYQAEDIRAYSRALRWRVDEFFRRIYTEISRSDVLLVYTGDHGQNLYDKPYDATHCTNKDPSAGEALVPLLAFTGNADELKMLQKSARSGPSALHEDIVPTLYKAMGYDVKRLSDPLQHTLYDLPPQRTRRFFTGNQFSSSMRWYTVDD